MWLGRGGGWLGGCGSNLQLSCRPPPRNSCDIAAAVALAAAEGVVSADRGLTASAVAAVGQRPVHKTLSATSYDIVHMYIVWVGPPVVREVGLGS